MGLRVIGYIRVSSNSQSDNTSFESQTRAITRFCQRSDHELVEIRSETGSASGKAKRKVFEKLLKDILHNKADGLVVYRLDRFARSTLEGLQTATLLKTAKKDLLVVDLGFDTSTPMGTCILSVLLSFAELERSMIKSRVEEGRARVIQNGFYGGGRPKYGFQPSGPHTRRALIAKDGEHEILDYIIDLHRDGFGTKQIADQLNREGYRARHGGKWYHSTVRNILQRIKSPTPTVGHLELCH